MSTDNEGNWRALADAYVAATRALEEPPPPTESAQFLAKAMTMWLADHGYRLIADDGKHYAQIGPDGWSLQHPSKCRDDMLSCWFHEAAQDQWQEQPAEAGRYWIDRGSDDDPNDLVLVERVA